MQDGYSFLQNAQKTKNCKNCNKLYNDKNQINKNCYKTKSNFLCRAVLLSIWLLVFTSIVVSLILLQPKNNDKTISAAGDPGMADIYAYVGSYSFSDFNIYFNGEDYSNSIEYNENSSGSYWGTTVGCVSYGLLEVTAAPNGYKWKLRTGTVQIVEGSTVKDGEGAGHIFENSTIKEYIAPRAGASRIISIELVKVGNDVSINVSITGNYKSEASGVILYLMKDNAIQSQIVANNNVPIKLTQKIGETFTILVSKPYMWTMTVSGDCTRDDDNKNKITYTVASTSQTITLEFSGGCASSMIAV